MSARLVIPVGGTLFLRQLKIADAPALFALVDANRDHLSQFNDTTALRYPTLSAVVERIMDEQANEVRFGIWDGNVLVGFIKAGFLSVGLVEIGYWLGEQHSGRGYMTAAVRALTAWAYGLPKVQRVFARVLDGNDKSAAVLLRAGYTQYFKRALYLFFSGPEPK